MQMDSFLTLKGGNVELVGAPETIFVLPIGTLSARRASLM